MVIPEDYTPTIQGVCKDCGNGTLNNTLVPAFDFADDENGSLYCLRCGSQHVDCL